MSERTLEDRVCETMCMVLSGRPIAGCAERERGEERLRRGSCYMSGEGRPGSMASREWLGEEAKGVRC